MIMEARILDSFHFTKELSLLQEERWEIRKKFDDTELGEPKDLELGKPATVAEYCAALIVLPWEGRRATWCRCGCFIRGDPSFLWKGELSN